MNIAEKPLAIILSRNWWVLLLRGIIAIMFGVLAWLKPGISLMALVLLFGAYTLADGILGVWLAIAGRKEDEHWWILLLWGFISIIVGILTFLTPSVTALALLIYIAIWAIATGVLEIVAAIRLRREIRGEWLLILVGIASVMFGALLMAKPGAGALALLWLIATYAVIFGVLLIILAFKARTFGNQVALHKDRTINEFH
ncbi:MAG: HdeD family acid-resistance protein [bacterium]